MKSAALRVVRLLPCLLGTTALFLLFIQIFSSDSPSKKLHTNLESVPLANKDSKAYKVKKAFEDWHKCFVSRFELVRKDVEKLWWHFAYIIQECTTTTAVSRIGPAEYMNYDDIKFYVFSQKTSDPSVVVSLGIGADITVELQLKEKLPQGSEFFGADPVVWPNDKLFSRVGTFFPVAVSKETGLVVANVRGDDGSYKAKSAVSVDIVTFLKKMVNRTVIDHIIVDVEGPEYDIFPTIAINDILENNGVLICQMNVEFHAPGPMERLPLFERIVSGVLSSKRFAPLYTFFYNHQSIFFINYDHPYCVEKYLTQFFQ